MSTRHSLRPPRSLTRLSALLSLAVGAALVACDGPSGPADAGADAARPDTGGPECTFDPGAPEEIAEPAPYTPRWAFQPWISKDISDREDTIAFVQGFMERDIPVGAVVIDSPWDIHYTTFTPNEARYGDFASLVERMHDQGVHVVMWTTQMVNRSSFDLEMGGDSYRGASPNYGEGLACGYFVNDGRTYSWWKGIGSGVDFFHPDARAWWHRQQDRLLDMGIDGWKLDFGESYMEGDDPVVSSFDGEHPFQDYSEAYYQDFLAYGRHRRGQEFLTMVRPWDESYDRRGRFHARPEHTPVGWVGDNHRDWSGVLDVLDHLFRSADRGYVVIGSDIGGYLDRNQDSISEVIPFDIEVFQRWTAMGALTPFMQLHGRANLAPWTVEERADETVELYRYWATLHTEMVPFWYSLSQRAYAEGGPIMHPIGATPEEWQGDWRYLIGEALLVAPLIEAGGVRDVELPAGARWLDWWAPEAGPIDGGTTLTDYTVAERLRYPLFLREGAILPMEVGSSVTGMGDEAHEGHWTILTWPGTTGSQFQLWEDDETVTTIDAVYEPGGLRTEVVLSRAVRPTILRIYRENAEDTAVVRRNAVSLTRHADRAAFDAATEGYLIEAPFVWVKVESSAEPLTIEALPPL